MATEQYTTLGESTLVSSIISSDTALDVASASSFPSSGNFRIRIDSEICKVTGVSGTTYTISRGQEGTTAASHTAGSTITEVLTAAALNAIRDDVSSVGLYSALPSTTGQRAGNQYHLTDRINRGIFYDGSAWQPTGAKIPVSAAGASQAAVIPTSGWSIINSAKINDFFTDSIRLYIKDSGSVNLRLYTRTIPSSNYTLYAVISGVQALPAVNSQTLGVYISDGTKYEGFELLSQSGAPNQLRVQKVTDINNYSTTPFGPTADLVTSQLIAVKIVDDGANRKWYYWTAGAWVLALTEATNTFLTETKAGFGGLSVVNNASYFVEAELLFWSVE